MNIYERFWGRVARATAMKSLFPQPVKRFVRLLLPREAYYHRAWRAADKFADAEEISSYPAKVDIRLGIIREFTHEHKNYIGACRDLGVPYKLLDISGPDWIDVIKNSGCNAFLVRPSAHITVWKQMYDERLKVVAEELGKIIYPTYDEIWFYESKRRMHYWLEANKIPHPRTWVFYDRENALQFAKETKLPIVYKSDFGSGASGVRIFKKCSILLRFVNKCFKKGFIRRSIDSRDIQWGSVLFQEYLPDVAEWRVLRLGNSYFGHQKLKKGEFHSGSLKVGWYDPPKKLLDFARSLTDKGGFTSMNVDIFETSDGRYLVNELQSLFGSYLPYQMLVNGQPGRYLYDKSIKNWVFEKGIFCQNGSCNLRVQALVETLGHRVELPKVDVNAMVSNEDKEASMHRGRRAATCE
jgi:glutathione synthase/RimK-type ligase-like ATP-grasp enzyme